MQEPYKRLISRCKNKLGCTQLMPFRVFTKNPIIGKVNSTKFYSDLSSPKIMPPMFLKGHYISFTSVSVTHMPTTPFGFMLTLEANFSNIRYVRECLKFLFNTYSFR